MSEKGGKGTIVIGLAGHAQVGKDTIGKVLVDNYGFTRVSFADNVREAVLRLNPFVIEPLDLHRQRYGDFSNRRPSVHRLNELVNEHGYEYCKTHYPEVRRLLQVMGTEVGREMFGQNCWTEMAARQATGPDRVVFTDVRFSNEAEKIRSLGGEVWLVERAGTGPVNDHASDCIDFETEVAVDNDGTLDDLQDWVRGMMQREYGLS